MAKHGKGKKGKGGKKKRMMELERRVAELEIRNIPLALPGAFEIKPIPLAPPGDFPIRPMNIWESDAPERTTTRDETS